MANIKPTEKLKFEKLLGMSSGYVLDFSNPSFQQFIDGIVKIEGSSSEVLYLIKDGQVNQPKNLWYLEIWFVDSLQRVRASPSWRGVFSTSSRCLAIRSEIISNFMKSKEDDTLLSL